MIKDIKFIFGRHLIRRGKGTIYYLNSRKDHNGGLIFADGMKSIDIASDVIIEDSSIRYCGLNRYYNLNDAIKHLRKIFKNLDIKVDIDYKLKQLKMKKKLDEIKKDFE